MWCLTNTVCPVCKQDIEGFIGNYMLAIEKPYANILIHMDCYLQNKENMLEILQETLDLWYNIKYNEKIFRKRGKKSK